VINHAPTFENNIKSQLCRERSSARYQPTDIAVDVQYRLALQFDEATQEFPRAFVMNGTS
jgi:hypothetical protein